MAKLTAKESAELKRRITEHMKNADRFLKAGAFDRALIETEHVLALDPGNIYAQAFRKKINEVLAGHAGRTGPTVGESREGETPPEASSPSGMDAPEPAVSAEQYLTENEPVPEQRGRRGFQRKLAAIMFTDMVNYSELTQKNEVLTVQLLEEHRRILRPLFSQFEGDEIKTIGDAFLVEFVSVLQAVRCAIAIQNDLALHNKLAPMDRQILLRIGIHLGDVIYQEEDIIGDGVNIASRIQSSAEPGGICISQDVFNQIRSQQDIHTEEIGEVALKGIIAPVRLYKVYTSDEAYRRIEEQALQSAIEEGKQKAFAEMVDRCLNTAREAMKQEKTEDVLAQLFALYVIDPENKEAKRIEADIVGTRRAAFQQKLDETRKVPREFFLEMYGRLLKCAWSDGTLSTIEISLLDGVRGSFRITEDEHHNLDHAARLEIYHEHMKAVGEKDTPDERQLVERLRKELNITDQEHAEAGGKSGSTNAFS